MGMAASQARYLALTARKTNAEWEGQQINQARTALANQSANLFNRLLGLEVPNAPKTTDYTELQYSFSDGDNESVLESWHQLSNANPDYNYVVNSYYFANIYTGAEKKLADPQVHIQSKITENPFIDPTAVLNADGTYRVTFPNGYNVTLDSVTSENVNENDDLRMDYINYARANGLNYKSSLLAIDEVFGYKDASDNWQFATREELEASAVQNPDGTFTQTLPSGSTVVYSIVSPNDINENEQSKNDFKNFSFAKGLAYREGIIPSEDVYGYQDASGDWHFFLKEEIQNIDRMKPVVTMDPVKNTYTITTADGSESFTYESLNDVKKDTDFQAAFNEFKTAFTLSKEKESLGTNDVYAYKDASGNWNFYLKDEINSLDSSEFDVLYDRTSNSYTITPAGGTESFVYKSLSDVESDEFLESDFARFADATIQSQIAKALQPDNIYAYHDDKGGWHFFSAGDIENPREYSASRVAYVGNCRADELGSFTKEQAAELAQILRDQPESSISQYLKFDDDGYLIYDGMGIYTFTMNGKTYFTTEKDLYHSINHPLEKRKPIDVQDYLRYYNANYVKTKIEQTNNALLETDKNGRFKSVKFDNDSVVYSLNVETVTNEAAYQDAMNEYLYKKEVYEKTIADINAKTSIIQQEDRTLELRLKQLDTEQNALATEMDAVKKVIKDNVEKTFKTFSD